MKYKTENNEQMDTDGKKEEEEEKKTMIEETGEMFLCKNS